MGTMKPSPRPNYGVNICVVHCTTDCTQSSSIDDSGIFHSGFRVRIRVRVRATVEYTRLGFSVRVSRVYSLCLKFNTATVRGKSGHLRIV